MNSTWFVDSNGTLPPDATQLVGRIAGLVDELAFYVPQRTAPDVVKTSVAPNDVDELLETPAGSWATGAAGFDVEACAISAVGELCERYCVYQASGDCFVGSYDELTNDGEPTVDFEYLDVLDRERVEQIDLLNPVTKRDEFRWTRGLDLLTGEEVAVPAQLVYALPDVGESAARRFVGTSNGCACGQTATDACARAILELLERDGFMRTWLTQTSPDRIDVGSLAGDNESPIDRLLRRVEGPNRSCHLVSYDGPTDVHTVGAVVESTDGSTPSFVVGGGAGIEASDAIEDAVAECAQMWITTRQRLARGRTPPDTVADVLNLSDNVLYYADPDNRDETSVLLEGPRKRLDRLRRGDEGGGGDECGDEHGDEGADGDEWGGGDGGSGRNADRDRLDVLLSELDDAGLTPLAFDLTTRDLRDVGWHVVRVVVPELVDLTPPSLLPRRHPAFEDVETTTKPHPFG
jgi:ribosomal protein S12 methylthiotransferase accessory factor